MDSNILLTWGAITKKIEKGEFLFHEGDDARYYYQIETGSVKLFNVNDEGKEFTQETFYSGECFGEAFLFINEKYPVSAISTHQSVIYKLSKDRFFQILNEYRNIERDFLCILAKRIYSKTITASEVINNSPEHRILAFLDHCRKIANASGCILIPYTRQEIANHTGLRVETVIRTLSVLSAKKKLSIKDRKLYY